MLLHSPAYLVFLFFVVLGSWLLPYGSLRKYWLLGASYIFYSMFNFQFATILVGLSIFTYCLGRSLANGENRRTKIWLGVFINLLVLGYFKYVDFFLDSFSVFLQSANINHVSPALQILLPVGISFFTFQSISYFMEINRRKLSAGASLVDVSLYLAFFPKLIAGPLIRPSNFFFQLAKPVRSLKRRRLAEGISKLLLGFFKKIVIADGLASVADVAFQAATTPNAFGFPSALYLQGFYLYAIQIYADFSGYTDIAIGSAHLLGFELPQNFNRPYFATTITGFWNRWHISLTQWFREYIFFPISRRLLKATKRRYPLFVQTMSNLITMTLIGLWHGASWSFVTWGFFHGVLISLERMIAFDPKSRWILAMKRLLTFHFVGFGWILFRADSFSSALYYLGSMFQFQQLNWLSYYLPTILLPGILLFSIEYLRKERFPRLFEYMEVWQPSVRIAAMIAILSILVLNTLRNADPRPFIYGQF